ncbi:MAG TPA: GMC family oxidoreductase [Ilumatobacter sp.]|nr:GMC family oxidoreductase [Ilumatobacter sp.]
MDGVERSDAATEQSDDTVVVIGSGPCGALAAHQLSAAGQRVTVLDSGLRAPRGIVVKAAGHTLFRWVDRAMWSSGRQASATDPATEWHSSLALGGLTNYWTGTVPRFAPDDFTDGGRLDARYEWPIGYTDLEPYYRVAEQMMTPTAGEPIPGVPVGESTYQARLGTDWAEFAARANTAGFAVGAAPRAKGRPWMIALRGNEFDSFHAILAPLVRSGAVQLRRGAHAIRLLHEGGRATAVEYLDRDAGIVRTLHAKAFVVAAGTLDTTEILLRSASGELPGGLGSSTGVLGRYLHDHPREWYPVRLDRPFTALVDPVYFARDAHESADPLLATASTFGLASWRYRVRALYGGSAPAIGLHTFGTMVPSPERGVSLVGAHDPASTASRLHIDLVYDQAAVANMHHSRERVVQLFHTCGVAAELGAFSGLAPGSSVHYGGTARMHRDPAFGVIDEWNRVYDAPNVVVADASCFTTGPEKNPTLTAMAIAARAADRLALDLSGSPDPSG